MGENNMSVGKIRRAAEVLLGPFVLKRSLPAEAGGAVLFVSGRVGGLRYLLKPRRHWDSELLRIAGLLVKKGSSVWDVGANVGLFSRAAAFHAGSDGVVVAMEADSEAVSLIRRSCRFRPDDHAKITILPVAVSATCGFVSFEIAMRSRSANAIHGFGSTQTGGVAESRTLPCVALDSMLEHFRPPDVLKIDVEGAELDVLRGGRRIIEVARPFIYCEVQGNTWVQVSELLERQGYRLWDARAFRGPTQDVGVSAETSDILAIPEEKIGQMVGANG